MNERTRISVKINRQFKELLKSADLLLHHSLITKEDFDRITQGVYIIRDDLKKEYRTLFNIGSKPSGRPKTKAAPTGVCKKPGCNQPSSPGQVYCSKDHAPYGFYSREFTRTHKVIQIKKSA